MKTQTILKLSVALLAASSMFAEGSQRLNFQVPFGFHVGDKTLPSGQYTVSTDPSQGLVVVRSADARQAAMALAAVQGPARSNEGKLIFSRYGDQYFLSEIWHPRADRRILPKTKREKEEAANISPQRELIVAAK